MSREHFINRCDPVAGKKTLAGREALARSAVGPRTEFRRRITEILRDEFAEERWQGVVDRTLPDP